MTGKYGTPYFANFLNSDMDPEDARSMCPLYPEEKVLVINKKTKDFNTSIVRNLHNNNSDNVYQLVHNGEIKKAKINRFDNIDSFYEITLINGHKIKVSDNHLNLTYDGVKKTTELTVDDYLPLNKKPLEGIGLSYEEGLLVGAFLGDGSFKDKNTTVYSLNVNGKKEFKDWIIKYVEEKLGAKTSELILNSQISDNSFCVNVSIHSKYLRGLIEEFVIGDKSQNKEIHLKVLNKSIDFRKGIVDGLYKTDGGNKNRIYSSSKRLIDSMNTVFMSLGIATRIDVDDRKKEDGKLSDSKIYCIRFYNFNGRKKYKNLYKIDDDYNWFKIKEINKLDERTSVGYCFEVLNDDEPYFMMPNGIVTHNCRLRLDKRELKKRGGGLFGSAEKTGSIGVVTLNMPRYGYLSKSKKELYRYIDKYMLLAKNSLELKRKFLQKQLDRGLLPAFSEYVGTINNHFNTIGLLGLNELCYNFLGKGINTKEGHALSIEILEYMRERVADFQEETGNLYNLEATPAESTAYRLALKDTRRYKDIYTQKGINNEPYYTNSCHLPVNEVENITHLFDHQNDLQKEFTGGTVVHVYLEESISGEKVKELIKSICENYEVPYISFSPVYSVCSEHGFLKGFKDSCPICGKKTESYQRITGYIRPISKFNAGKKAEYFDRSQIYVHDQA